MKTLIVTDQKQEWFEVPDAPTLTARRYLAETPVSRDASVRVLNLCRTGRYQGRGYYVSLLAEARGQRPIPEVKTVEDLKSEAFLHDLSTGLESAIREGLLHDESDRFELAAYLGKDPAKRHDALAAKLFAKVRAPLLRAIFRRSDGRWELEAVEAIGVADVPPQDRALLLDTVKAFAKDSTVPKPRPVAASKPRIAILWDPKEPYKPSNEEALQRLVKAAPLVGLEAELVEPDALERLPEFDALFNRASPEVKGFVYDFVRRAESLGMPVVDDPESILKCLNKVYMYELMSRHGIAQPRTLIVHRANVDAYVKPMNAALPDGTRVSCKRRGLRVTLRVGTKKGDGLMRRLQVSPDPVVMLAACLQEAAAAAGVQLQITATEILIAP